MSILRKIFYRSALGYASLGVAYLTFPYWPESEAKYGMMAYAKNRTQTILSLWTIYSCVRDYRYNVEKLEGTDDYRAELRAFHIRVAERIYNLCVRSKGLYIKFGQYISTLDRVIPKEVADVLKKLQDQVPPHELSAVEVVLDSSLPAWKTQVYRIDPVAIGSASLAQVHKAELMDGTKVAIKIQYPELLMQFELDLRTLSWLVQKAGRMMQRHGVNTLNVHEVFSRFKHSIRQEIDFISEARNGEATREMLANGRRDDVVVPKYFHELTSERVLTMEYLPGMRIDNVEGIRDKLGLDPKRVGDILVDLYLRMIFDSGRIHCDPHPGNLLVRPHPFDPRQPQVILLDHGFYKTLTAQVQDKFTELWMALVNRDNERIRGVSRWFGIEKKANYLSLIFLFKTQNVSRLGEQFSPDEIQRLRDKQILSLANVSDMLGEFPDDFLMIIRTMNMVSMRNVQLGNTQRDRLLKTTRKVHQRYHGEHFWWRFYWAVFRVKLWLYENFYWAWKRFESNQGELEL